MDNLLKISLVLSLLGICILLFLSQRDSKQTEIKEIQDNSYRFMNRKVSIEGRVRNEKDYSNEKPFKILELQDKTGSIQVTCNCPTGQNLTGKFIHVDGKVTEYKKQVQVQADEIVLKER